VSQNKGKDKEPNEKPKEGENKPQTAKGQPAELLYMGSTPIPGSKSKTFLSIEVPSCLHIRFVQATTAI